MLDEIVDVFATVPAGRRARRHARRRRPQPRRSSTPATTSRCSASTAIPTRSPPPTARLERFGDRFHAVHARFDDLRQIMHTDQIASPPHLDVDASLERRAVRPRRVVAAARPRRARLLVPPRRAARHAHGHRPRRGRRPTSSTATDVDELARVIRRYGDERFARRIARAIVAARPIETTAELAGDRDRGHPGRRPPHRRPSRPSARSRRSASRSTASSTCCPTRSTRRSRRPGPAAASPCSRTTRARTASSRSASARPTGACDCPPDLPCVCGAVQTVRLVRGVPKRPTAAERAANRRAASARLRVAERDRADDRRRPDGAADDGRSRPRRVDAPRRRRPSGHVARPPTAARRRRRRRARHVGPTPARAAARAPAARSPSTPRSCSASWSSC